MKKCIFKIFKTDISFCILKIILFAYGYLFEQQRSSHDEYLMNEGLLNKRVISSGRNTLQSRGMARALSIIWGNPVKIRRISQKANQLGANLHLDHLGHSDNESCLIRHLLVVRRHNTTNSDNSLLSENTDIVEKILRKIKDPLG